MSARTYNIDGQAAANANSGGKRITEAGAYVGKLKFCFWEQNSNGTESMNLLFAADNGQEAGPLALYTHNSSGEPLPSYDMFNAIMACMKIKTLQPKKAQVELYDYNTKGMVSKTKDVYPEMANKPIGLFLRLEEYESQSGEVKKRLVVVGAFEPSTKLMASEIMTRKTDARAYQQMFEWVTKNPIKTLKKRRASEQKAGAPEQLPPGEDFVDDSDIPF